MKRIIIACGGGPASLKALTDLQAPGAEIVAVTVDTGQGGSVDTLRDTLLAHGAVRAHVIDARDEFARVFLVPALNAGVRAGAGGAAIDDLARALVAQKLVEAAALEQAGTIVIGGTDTRSGSSVAAAIAALDPNRSVLVVPAAPPPFDVRSPLRPAPQPAIVRIACESGMPVAINGIAMAPADLLESLTTIGAVHGIGRPRRAKQARPLRQDLPAACVLAAARQALAERVLSGEERRFGAQVAIRYAALVRRGDWFSPLRRALDAFVRSLAQRFTGAVTLTLTAGEMTVADVISPFAIAGRAPALTVDGLEQPEATAAGLVTS
jgi:argininosuccinate synthase